MNEDSSAKRWLFAMMESLSRDDFARVAVTLWAIWYAQRKIIHEEEFQSPLSTHLFIERYLQDLSIVGPSKKMEGGGKGKVHPRWIRPEAGCAKLNVDAALSKSMPGGAVGVVCRREDGSFLGASCLTINGISDPAILDALACREAIALAHDLQLQKITVASDCASVVTDMTKPYAGRYSTVIREIKEAAKFFAVVTFRYENCASNSEAHRLARFAASAEFGHQVWLVGPPDSLCILDNVLIQ
jgi:hypothetical protein